MTFQGKITYISPKSEGTSQAGKPWQKVEIVVTESGTNYPNELLLTAMNDRLQQFAGIKVGDLVTVEYDLHVREYNGRRYQNASLYKISKAAEAAVAPQPQVEQAVAPAPTPAKVGELFTAAPMARKKKEDHDFNKPDETDGLPF